MENLTFVDVRATVWHEYTPMTDIHRFDFSLHFGDKKSSFTLHQSAESLYYGLPVVQNTLKSHLGIPVNPEHLMTLMKMAMDSGVACANLMAIATYPQQYFPQEVPVSEASKSLPGVQSVVNCPAHEACGKRTVWEIIQHLNDHVGWSREQIADWLDDLADKGLIDIEFEPWNEE